MKQFSFFLLWFLLSGIPAYPQGIINTPNLATNEEINQISSAGIEIDNILNIQNLNQGFSNYVLSQQYGDQNKASINQQRDPGSALTNQAVNFQQGNFNELILGQIGSGNLFLGFQLGYIATATLQNQYSQFNFGFAANIPAVESSTLGVNSLTEGEENRIEVTQEGENNGIVAVQQGDGNNLSAGQNGTNNYLLVLQRGTKNSVEDYRQENMTETPLFDTIIQEGENLSLRTDGISRSNPNRNTFSQTGSNLSLVVNSEFVNSSSGIEINQTGMDMGVVVDQSYFPDPLNN